MDNVTLREYQPGDVDAMYALDVVCFEPVFRFSRKAMRSFAESQGAVTILAEINAELVGFCIAQMEGEIAYVVTLDVAPTWRRRGLARQLMTELETRVRSTGAISIALHVFEGNSSAMQFYEDSGYTRVGLVKAFYGRGLDALLYGKKL